MWIKNYNCYQYKYLGVTIDSNLKWSDHIEAVKTKLTKHTVGTLLLLLLLSIIMGDFSVEIFSFLLSDSFYMK